MLLKACRFIDN